MPSFSQYAIDKMKDLYNNHSHEVGIELKKNDPTYYASYKSTDCTTYVLNVLSYAYQKSGDSAFAKQIWTYGKDPSDPGKRYKGTVLGKKLVTQKNWVGIYVNPDVVHPRDSMDEHTFTYYVANKYCHYHNIPVKYQTVNYNPTPTSHPNFQSLMKHKGQTTLNSVDIAALKNIQFGIGMSRGGAHMWLFSKGYVFEVHWDEVPSLYEKRAIEDFPWLSNVIIVPPDGASTISVAACACAAAP